MNSRDHDVKRLPNSLLIRKNLWGQRPAKYERLNMLVLKILQYESLSALVIAAQHP